MENKHYHYLKPCPFCGGRAEGEYRYSKERDTLSGTVACLTCKARIFGLGVSVSMEDFGKSEFANMEDGMERFIDRAAEMARDRAETRWNRRWNPYGDHETD